MRRRGVVRVLVGLGRLLVSWLPFLLYSAFYGYSLFPSSLEDARRR